MARLLEVTDLLAPAHTVTQTCATAPNGQEVCTQNLSGGFVLAGGAVLLVYLLVLVVMIIAYVSIIRKAGYSGWWVLVGIVPVVNVVFFLIFAFSTWPVVAEVHRLRSMSYGSGPPGRPGPAGSYVPVPVPLPTTPPPAGGPSPGVGERPPAPVATVPGAGAEPEPAAMTGETAVIPSFGEVMRAGGMPAAAVTPTAEPVAQATPGAGWFPSPEGPPGRLRYWDGANWTDQYH